MEYYLALERKEILQYATTRRNLEDIMQNEINQSQKDKYYMIPLILGTQNNQNHRDRKNSGYQGLEGGGEWGVTV